MDLYKATGLDRTFISDLERGIQAPSIRTIFRAAKGIGIEAESLIEKTKNSRFFVFPDDWADPITLKMELASLSLANTLPILSRYSPKRYK